MKYIENGFCPAWLPLKYRGIIDLSELAEPTEQIIREANTLMEILAVNIAIYKGLTMHQRESQMDFVQFLNLPNCTMNN